MRLRQDVDFRWAGLALKLAGAGAAVIWLLSVWLGHEAPSEPGPPYPKRVEMVGTNELTENTMLWTPVNGSFFGRVEHVSHSHRFADGTVRPGVMIYRDRMRQWVPLEDMGHLVKRKK